jgi:hypothetical protein
MSGIQDGIGNQEARHRLTADDMRFNDFIHIFGMNASIPDGFRIDNDRGTEFALIEASRLIGTNVFDAARGQFSFEQALQLALTRGVAASARVARLTLIHTNENMSVEFWHGKSLAQGALTQVSCRGSGGIFLASALDASDDANPEQDDSAHGDPVGRNVHEVSAIDQTADQDQKSESVKSEGHGGIPFLS